MAKQTITVDVTNGQEAKDILDNNFDELYLEKYLSNTETAAGTTTLTVNSNRIQEFTGTTTQTIVMPVVDTFDELGETFKIINNSTGQLTVNSSGSDLITTIAAGITKIITCVKLTGTDETSWSVNDFGGSGGASTFLGLTDTPSSYSGQANKVVSVNSSANGLEFTTSGGGAATQVAQGTAYTFLGELLNESFPGTSLSGTNWSDSLPTGASVNDKLIIASGSAAWDRFITLSKHYLYEKLTIQVDVTAVTKASGDAWGWSQTNFSAYTNTYVFWKFDQFTGILSAGTNSSANQYGEMQPIEFSAGDNLRFTWNRTPTKTTVVIENLTDSSVSKAYGEWSQFCKWGSGNYYRLTFLGGQQEFTNITIDSTVRNYIDNSDGVVFIGDSIGNGFNLENRNDRFPDVLMKDQTHQYENLCIDSWGTDEYTTARLTEFLTNVNAKYLIINLGYNDAARGVALATYQTNLENLATTAQGLGFEVIFISPWPNLSLDKSDYNTYMGNAATATSCKFIDDWIDLTDSDIGKSEYYSDGVHPNVWGHKEKARLDDLQDGELIDLLNTSGNTSDILMRDIPFSSELLPPLIVDSKGNVFRSEREKYINRTPIELQSDTDSDGYSYYTQTGNIRISGRLQNNAEYIQKADSTGLKIGFSNDVNDTLGSNINITNKQNASGRKQLFSTISGVRNLLVQGLTVKAGYTHQITGNDNTVIMCQGFTSISGHNNTLININTIISLSSGQGNIGIGVNALKGVSTASKNIMIGNMSNNLTGNNSNRLMLGNFTDTNNNANMVNISPGDGSVFWFFGGSGQYSTPDHTFTLATNYSCPSDGRGANYTFRTGKGKGTGLAQFIVECWDTIGTPSSNQTSRTNVLVVDRLGIQCNTVFKLPQFTATEASALTPANGDLIYVTSTDATFTSVDVWAYVNGSWTKK